MENGNEKAAVAEPPAPEVRLGRAITLPDEAEIDKALAALGRQMAPKIEEQMEMSPTGEFENDVVVIGSGPGGYVAAIRAAQLGARTVCIEKEATEWGGTCLNWGCIPTKTLIASVERLHHVKTAAAMGVIIGGEISFDYAKMMERKTKVVGTLARRRSGAFEKQSCQIYRGNGAID